MKKIMTLLILAFMGLTTAAQEKPKATSADAQELIPVYATIKYYLEPAGPSGTFWIETSTPVGTRVRYTTTINSGYSKNEWYFYVDRLSSSSQKVLVLDAIAGRAKIIAVSPASDGIYDYTAAIGSETDF